MKVLHVFDCAASACLISREQRKNGIDAKVTNYALMDPFGFLDYYGEDRQIQSAQNWMHDVINNQVPNYDIIHVHFIWQLIPLLKSRYPEKKVIMHFQGSDARQYPYDKERIMATDMADAVMYSIGDIKHLMPERAVRFYAPIDSELFHPVPDIEKSDKKLIFLTQPMQSDKEKCLKFILDLGIERVRVIDRTKHTIPYPQMFDFLKEHGTYIDIRYQNGSLINDWSSTASQCLNMGMNVIDWAGETHRGLPDIYKSANIMEQIKPVYESLSS